MVEIACNGSFSLEDSCSENELLEEKLCEWEGIDEVSSKDGKWREEDSW